MKKIVYTLLVTSLLISCSKVKKDAQTIADLKCLAMDAHGDKRDVYEKQIDDISVKYTGADLVELEKQVAENLKKCPAKIKEDKETAEFEKEMQEMDKEVSSNNSSDSSSDSNDIDQMLTDYEEFTDEYIAMYKKSLEGDVSAMSDYPDVLEKAQGLEQKLKDVEKTNKLTKSQIKRMNNIAMKYLDAMPNNYGE